MEDLASVLKAEQEYKKEIKKRKARLVADLRKKADEAVRELNLAAAALGQAYKITDTPFTENQPEAASSGKTTSKRTRRTAEEVAAVERDILRVITGNPEGIKASAIIEELSLPDDYVSQALAKLVNSAEIIKVEAKQRKDYQYKPKT